MEVLDSFFFNISLLLGSSLGSKLEVFGLCCVGGIVAFAIYAVVTWDKPDRQRRAVRKFSSRAAAYHIAARNLESRGFDLTDRSLTLSVKSEAQFRNFNFNRFLFGYIEDNLAVFEQIIDAIEMNREIIAELERRRAVCDETKRRADYKRAKRSARMSYNQFCQIEDSILFWDLTPKLDTEFCLKLELCLVDTDKRKLYTADVDRIAHMIDMCREKAV